jgi:hypothetical protein
MKNTFVLIFGTLLVVFVIAACGSSSSNDGNTATESAACGYGQVYVSSYNNGSCVQACPNNPNEGLLPTGQCVPGVPGSSSNPYNYYGSGGLTWAGQMQVTNPTLYQQFLQGYGLICNQEASTWLGDPNWGLESCSSYGNIATLILSISSSLVPASGFVSITAQANEGLYGYASTPVTISGTFNPINNNSGFELQTIGYYGTESYNATLQVVVNAWPTQSSGVATTTVPVSLTYNGGQFGEANATQY